MGSEKVSENGRMRAMLILSLVVISSASSSGSDLRLSTPLAFARRRRRRYKILAELVSGKRRNKTTSANPADAISIRLSSKMYPVILIVESRQDYGTSRMHSAFKRLIELT